MNKEIYQLKELQRYQDVVTNELKQLKQEKTTILKEQKEINFRQRYLKTIAIIMIALVVSMLVLLVILNNIFSINFMFPFIAIIIFGASVGFYIIYETYKNQKDMIIMEKKSVRVVSFINRVKIKYVNTTSTIDYLYEKYHVKHSLELDFIWREYLKEKDEELKLQQNTKKLNEFQEELLSLLIPVKVKDREIWLSQPIALFDAKEMVEGARGRSLMSSSECTPPLLTKILWHSPSSLAEG